MLSDAMTGATNAVASRLQGENGALNAIDPALINNLIQTLIQNLVGCFSPDPVNAVEHTQQYVTARWTADKGYERPIMRRVMFQARRAAARSGVHLTDLQQEAVAKEVLDSARTGGGTHLVLRDALDESNAGNDFGN